MDLVKTLWKNEDVDLFLSYLNTLENKDGIDFAKKIIKTNLPILAIPTKILRQIANTIAKGNFKSFLDLKIFSNYESISIYALLLAKLNKFEDVKYYLKYYLPMIENWAHVDILRFKIQSNNLNDYLLLSQQSLQSKQPFIRRFGLIILFQEINNPIVLENAFSAILSLNHEDHYYVIMMAAWLLCECVIKHYDQTLQFLNAHPIHTDILSKMIQKCRDSYRLNQETKDHLRLLKNRSF